MHFKTITMLAVSAAVTQAAVLGRDDLPPCNSNVDTTVGDSCSDSVGTQACASTNTAVVSKALIIMRFDQSLYAYIS